VLGARQPPLGVKKGKGKGMRIKIKVPHKGVRPPLEQTQIKPIP